MSRTILYILLFITSMSANAALGLMELQKNETSGIITIFYPTSQRELKINRGGFEFNAAENAAIQHSNKRLIVISHGSPASPWVYLKLTEALVERGFVVVFPEHEGDNYKDDSDSGIPSWKRRPQEITKAIIRLSTIDFLKDLIDFNNIGMYGMSAGGHTALTLAGGKWSPSKLLKHCKENMNEDFHACAGPFINQDTGLLGSIKTKAIQLALDYKLSDENWYEYTDKRIMSIIAGVPFAADFDPVTLKSPRVHLGLIVAKKDIWLLPKYHITPIVLACQTCTVFQIENGSHGSLLAPIPKIQSEAIAKLISDPPDFNRSTEVDNINSKIVGFFLQTLHVQ